MAITSKQAFTVIWFMVVLTALGIILVLFSSVTFGPGIGMLSVLVFSLVSIFSFVLALMYTGGYLEPEKIVKIPLKKSEIKSLILSAKDKPFKVKTGRKSDITIAWALEKPERKEYSMSLWLDEKTHTCRFREEVKKTGKAVKIGPKYGNVEELKKKEKSVLVPSIWPLLKGGKDFDPYEARKIVWDACHKCGWEMVRS